MYTTNSIKNCLTLSVQGHRLFPPYTVSPQALFVSLCFLFKVIDYFLHTRSLLRLCLQASPDESSNHTVCYKCNLLFTLFRIWHFLDRHLTKKNTKTVYINLNIEKHL